MPSIGSLHEKVYDVNECSVSFTLPKPLYTVHCGRGDNAYDILEIFAGFDIETTNVQFIDGWYAFAYHMQVCISNQREKCVYLFRRWEVWEWFIYHIISYYNLGSDRKLIMWVANLSFEFQFIRRRLQWDQGDYDFFAKEERQPLKATYHGLEFREALSISGGNLEHLAKTYCTTQKMVGDLDYRKERNSKTPLTDEERRYCINDVVILAEFSQAIFDKYIRPDKKVPMTKTSILISEYNDRLKTQCRLLDKQNGRETGTTLSTWKEYLLRCWPDEETYKIWFEYLFRGGYVHANIFYTDITVDVRMRDITSSYPAEMNLSYYPVTPFKRVEFKPEYLKKYCCILRVQYDHIETTTAHSIESKNKIFAEIGAKWDNGRLYYADYLEVYQTELDFEIYQHFYKAQGVTVTECYIAKRGKLPFYLLDTLNHYYRHKHHLKVTGQGDTQEYGVTKSAVNTNYGATVKRLKLDKITYTDDWGHAEIQPNYAEEIRKTILLPQWGIWVTAHARHSLLMMLHKLTMAGVKVVYMDTDSIKYIPSHKAEQIFKHYNNNKRRHLHNRKLRHAAFNDLGFFDVELKDKDGRPESAPFKTLGAKRYIYYDAHKDKVKATVAGMPKESIKHLGVSVKEIFDNFNAYGFELIPEVSGKLTTVYRDEEYSGLVGSIQHGEEMHEKSGVALYQIPFTLTISDEFYNLIQEKKEERPSL